MKIAFITDDGNNISMHFGHAAHYLVVTIDNGKETQRELREKLGHRNFSSENHEEHGHQEPHGFDPASQNRHHQMTTAIQDCQVLIAGGMGKGAYEHLKAMNIETVITDEQVIEEALTMYLKGSLKNQIERLH